MMPDSRFHDASDSSTEIVHRPAQTGRASAPAACLVQIYPTDSGIGTLHEVGNEPLTLGRDPDCEFPIDDPSVSRRHARIGRRDKDYYILDLRSTNGTYINDESALLRVLQDGDYLRIGSHIYRFLCGSNVEMSYYEELRRVATIDALTGIGNRRHLLEFLERELSRCQRYGRPLSVLLVDIDHFKSINDEFGHVAGDFTLQALAGRLRDAVRKEDLVGRYGGEEFAIVLTECNREGAFEMAERLRGIVEAVPFHYEGREFSVTVSLGVATTDAVKKVAPLDLIQQADDCLYRAKHSGRNCVGV